MNKRIQVAVVVLMVLFASLPAFALQPAGELKASVGLEWDKEAEKLVHNSTRTDVRLALEDNLDFGGRLHFSAKAWWDFKQKDGHIGVDQAWLSGYTGDLDYQVGRQLISWGTADGFNPTNYFARMSTDSLLSGDMSGDPLWAAQATYYGSNWSLTGVVVPFFTPQEIDDQMKQMMGAGDPQAALLLKAIEDTKKPKGLGKNSEIALRAETQIGGFDVQASFYSGFEPLPGMEMALVLPDPSVPVFEGTYRRQNFVGLATTGTVGAVGVWGELTYGGPVKFADPEANPLELTRAPLSVNEKYLQAVIGGDYTFAIGKGLLTQVQYIYRGQGSLMEPYIMPDIEFVPPLGIPVATPGEIKGASYLYGRLGYDFSTSASADLLILHGFQEKGGIIRPSFTYSFPHSIQLELSVIKPYGEEDIASFGTAGQFAVSYKF